MKYDCVIVGAGAVGLSIAYELSGHGLSLCVLDQAEPGRQTSWAGAGILPPANQQMAHDALGKLRGLSHELHPQWASKLKSETGIDVEYRQCGALHLAREAGEAASLIAAVAQWQADGVRVEEVDVQKLGEMAELLAQAASDGQIRKAYWLPDEAQVRSPRFTKALIAACLARGVEIMRNNEVADFRFDDDGTTTVVTPQGKVAGKSFCVAAGAWTRHMMQEAGVQLEIYPWRGQMVLLRGEPGLLNCVVNEGPNYLVPRMDGRILVGSTVEEVGFDASTTAEGIRELRQFISEVTPQLAELPIETSWAGLRPGTGDGFPFLGKVPGRPNVFVAAGHFRSGIQLAPATAVVMSQLIRGEEPEIDLRDFRLDRE